MVEVSSSPGVLLSLRSVICVVAGCTLDVGACDLDEMRKETVGEGHPLGNRLPLGSQLLLVTHCAFNVSALIRWR